MRGYFVITSFLVLVGVGCNRSDSIQGGDRGHGGWMLMNVQCQVPVDAIKTRSCLRSSPEIVEGLSAYKDEVVEDSIELTTGEAVHVWRWGRWAVDSNGKVYAMSLLG
jgi:hypothetical protein